jgi:acetylornithine deacetylase|tara:strand:+ start:1874 stop:2971 length:1098 start_codon:yes stop_codon:yes gene_type:complete
MNIHPLSEERLEDYYQSALTLLKALIRTPSLSKEEGQTGALLSDKLEAHGIYFERKHHNLWMRNKHFHLDKPTLLLNSHHDTVRPNEGYTLDPFDPQVKEGKLLGLGSNDAGASLVALLHAFIHFYEVDLPINLIFAATAEEEISGTKGLKSILADLGSIDYALVGEPTDMKMAIAEKGLMVLDVYVKGVAGHTARDVGDNAIYKAMHDVAWFKNHVFDKKSPTLGPVKMTVSMIEGGYQHNLIPDTCHFVVDVRTTDAYTHSEILNLINKEISSLVRPRSTHLNPSGLSSDHILIQAATTLGLGQFGSPTLSDQCLMPFSSAKIGPGLSERSHSADEFIYLDEIQQGIKGYIELITTLSKITAK